MTNNLKNFTVLITRQPKHSAELITMIEEHHGSCICVPLFEIEPTIDAVLKDKIQQGLKRAYMAICISRNAAELILPLVDKSLNIYWATMGPTTAKYLQQQGLSKVVCPPTPPFDSAALVAYLKSASINLANQYVMLFSGEDGLSWLGEELGRQGAQVELLSVYKRIIPELIPALPKFDIALISCVTSLISLKQAAAQHQLAIVDMPLLVVSDRIRQNAIEMGFLKVYTANSMSNADILSALLYLRKSQ